jgi:prepilin-type N-terminal cleavage/methylation domain-containing protein
VTRQRGLTLVEVLVALGILAFGVTAVMGLLAAGTAVQRRGIERTEVATLVDTAFAEVRGRLTYTLEVERLPRWTGPGDASRPVHALWTDRKHPGYESYLTDLLLTPLDTEDASSSDSFHVEMRVRRKHRGRELAETWHTVMVRRVSLRDMTGTPAE